MLVTQYQEELLLHCRLKFPQIDIEQEWRAFSGQLRQYSPRVDIAFGPFNTGPGPNIAHHYDEWVRAVDIRTFLWGAYNFHVQNMNQYNNESIDIPDFDWMLQKNHNSRCLISLEIENTSSKKHMMGSVINAASLGRVGIGVAFCPSAMRTFIRIVIYLHFLRRVEKNSYDTTNFLVMSVGQINSLVNLELE